MYKKERIWFPFILIGFTLILSLLIVVYMRSPEKQVDNESGQELEISAPDSETYKNEIISVISDFYETGDAEYAYNQLLEIRVPAEFKDLHFQLALLMLNSSNNSTLDISSDLDILREQYPWLP